jgi:hypothetical protein
MTQVLGLLKSSSAEIDYRPMASIDEMINDQDVKGRDRNLFS